MDKSRPLQFSSKKSPLRGGIFSRRWTRVFALLFLNALLRFKKKRAPIPQHPKKILVCNIASLGDAIISTTVLPVLKRHYPDAEIGFLAAAQARQLLQDHPLVTRVHTFDHWYENGAGGLWRTILEYLQGFRRSVKEISEYQYDLAIDLHPCFPNAIPLLFKTKIPVRIGYPTGGFSNLLTQWIPWKETLQYLGHTHLNLLRILGIDPSSDSPLPHYVVKSCSKELPENYLVVHMGTSNVLKEWDLEKWIQLTHLLHREGWTVVLTGQGAREQEHCDRVSFATGSHNYCNQLRELDFAYVVQHAKALISVDSAAVHFASAVQLPSVVLLTGIGSPYMWMPAYSLCRPLMHRVACAPCLNKRGCKRMSCVREIQVEEVLRFVRGLLRD